MDKTYEIYSTGCKDTELLKGGTPEEALLDYFHHHHDDDEVDLSLDEWMEKHGIHIYLCNNDGEALTELIKY